MSVNSKMTAIADNIRSKTGGVTPLTLDGMAAGVNDVYEAGKASMIDESKIIEKTVSGKIISVDDVSEIPHEVAIQLSSDTVTDFSGVTVKVCGKNLSGKSTIHQYVYGKDYLKYNEENAVVLPAGTYYISGTQLPYLQMFDVETKEQLLLADVVTFTSTAYYVSWNGYCATLASDASCKIGMTLSREVIVTMCGHRSELTDVQIEVGTYQTAYEAPMEPQTATANADGTVEGITSISPNMTVFTDNADVDITMDYHMSYGAWLAWNRQQDDEQQNGNRNNYMYAYYGRSDITYNPKYDINIDVYATGMFWNATITDTVVPITFTGAGVLTQMLNACPNLRIIRKLRVNENCTYANSFHYLSALEELGIEGVIGKNGVNFTWSSKLNKASITRLINCLSSTTTGLTITLSKTAVINAFGSTTATEWTNLIATKSNWTISLA